MALSKTVQKQKETVENQENVTPTDSNVDEKHTYSISEITQMGVIMPPSGSKNPLTIYNYIRNLILNKKLNATMSKAFTKHWEISGHAIIEYLKTKE